MIDFERMRFLISRLPDAYQKYQWAKGDYERIGSPIITDMPRSHDVGNPTERAVIKMEHMYEAYHEMLMELDKLRAQLAPLIDRLQDPTGKAVMRLRYMDGFSPSTIEASGLFPMSRRGIYYKLRESEQAILCWQRGQNG